MKRRTKFSPQQQQAAEHQARHQHQSAREFKSVEELLRYDAAQTPVPPGIVQRLQKAAGQPGPARRPWWRKWFD